MILILPVHISKFPGMRLDVFHVQQPTQNEGEVKYLTNKPSSINPITINTQDNAWSLDEDQWTLAGQQNTQPHHPVWVRQQSNSQLMMMSTKCDITMATATGTDEHQQMELKLNVNPMNPDVNNPIPT